MNAEIKRWRFTSAQNVNGTIQYVADGPWSRQCPVEALSSHFEVWLLNGECPIMPEEYQGYHQYTLARVIFVPTGSKVTQTLHYVVELKP